MLAARSYEPISDADLKQLASLAAIDRDSLFRRKSHLGKAFDGRLFAVALCQGAALHSIDGKNGIKDFDVWSFYSEVPDANYPYRRRAVMDFGSPKFGKTEGHLHFIGRRVDILGRSIPFEKGSSPASAIQRYLAEGKSETARQLSQKAVILIEPAECFGQIIWPIT